ncbi:MAG: aminopeptidase P family N-terminal domain-containing protein, partial [Gammaproteobacteria bacterium]|nr:aminopeptidase P family N-terminal domain-containing protein [Gammaproteobacteria bacterium]
MQENFDEKAIRAYRLNHVRQGLRDADYGGIVVFDPVNLRYATGSRNMQVWTMGNFGRYGFIPTEGPVVLFDLPSSSHLSKHLETIDEIRPSLACDYMMVGSRSEEFAHRWAQEIADFTGSDKDTRIAIDRADLLMTQAAEKQGLSLVDGKPIMEYVRAIKSDDEIAAFKFSLTTCEQSVGELRNVIQP